MAFPSRSPFVINLTLLLSVLNTIGQSSCLEEASQFFVETRPTPRQPTTTIPFQVRPETLPTEPMQIKQLASIKHYPSRESDRAIKVTINDHWNKYNKLENIIGTLDTVAFAISKPVAIINAFRLLALAISSMFMSTLMVPVNVFDLSKKRNRERHRHRHRQGILSYISRSDIEGLLNLMAQNYDETLNRAGYKERNSCRERSFCVLGDMMACDFPNFVVSAKRFAQNQLPPVDAQRNKYTKAFVAGLNQTDCDHVYRANSYECPSFQDYARSYFFGTRRRRDHLHWRKHL